MEPNRKYWNEQEQLLQNALARGSDHKHAIDLFLQQHAMTHSAQMSGAGLWSFEDEVLQGLADNAIRQIPPKGEHSIAWVLWHLARIEDITINLLVAGRPQLFTDEGWDDRLKAPIRHSGNAMNVEDVATLSAALDIPALKAYRMAVGRRTREVVLQIEPHELKQKVSSSRLQTVRETGSVLDEANEIIAYWGGRTIAGLLLMPPTRHNFLHLNEALRIRQKLARMR